MQGSIYTDQTVGFYSNGQESKKEGEACAYSAFGLLAWGDASVRKSQSQGLIYKINTIEQVSFSILGCYAKVCTVTKGN
ncbi:TRL domain-containing protein [Leptospira idonii]|uniref:TRL-like family protein n=1 Tax=Leptospira idonii TaxID=1193500 RepID=A0A4R9M2S7_9LEPT|nr:TRL domain-containing protein [Leptospira idonii]TGN20291.1 TRL-like family protein [Leptospira idonii]